MTLNEENRSVIVNYRLQRAKETLAEAVINVENCCWHAAANRLYYACFYTVTALLIKNGHETRTHNGVLTILNKDFVLEGLIAKEQSKLYGKILGLRQKGDYDDFIVVREEDILPLLEPAKQFIETIENLINDNN
jgi:uncharacterized protein (UPF0332 family)